MNACNFLKPTDDDVEAVIMLMGAKWPAAAKKWWDQRLAGSRHLVRYSNGVEALLLRRPVSLRLESYCCDQGNRQKRSYAGLTTKGTWEPFDEPKAVAFLRTLTAGTLNKVEGEAV